MADFNKIFNFWRRKLYDSSTIASKALTFLLLTREMRLISNNMLRKIAHYQIITHENLKRPVSIRPTLQLSAEKDIQSSHSPDEAYLGNTDLRSC